MEHNIVKIAIFGATSQIAKDLIMYFEKSSDHELTLFGREPRVIVNWLNNVAIEKCYCVKDYASFTIDDNYDVVINFIGVSNPAQAKEMGSTIFDITYHYDMMILNYLKSHENCKYIFLSSGAVYGGGFNSPVTKETEASFPINNLSEINWYAIAKMYAEARHRALAELNIVDVRIFNYFSHTQDLSARFLITDILRAIRDKTELLSSPEYIVRDFLHPSDFYQLVSLIISKVVSNTVVDCYSLAPIDKVSLLATMKKEFGLCYKVMEASNSVDATGSKPFYYSKNTCANDFGYRPSLTSIDGLLIECKKVLYRTSPTTIIKL